MPAFLSSIVRYSAVFFLLSSGLSLPGYLLGSCVRMASGHPAPRCPVSGTFAAGVLLSSPRCPVRASFASGFVLRLLAPHFMRVSLSPISYLLPSTGRSGGAFVCPFPGIECRLSFRPLCRMLSGFSFFFSPALNAGFRMSIAPSERRRFSFFFRPFRRMSSGFHFVHSAV